jgi:prefoldin beta subunit
MVFSQELAILEGAATVYKLVGPVLVKQDLEEAKQTVDKRLGYITSEV